jgi:hypothetical protein
MKNYSTKFTGLKAIEPDTTIPFASEGQFSMHELLEFLLQKTGPASVCIMSYSITEIAIRRFSNLMENGSIKTLECIFDFSVKRYRLGLLYFMNNVVTKVALTKNHSKIILIENENWKITVVGSANLNVNDKIEAGAISTRPGFYDFFRGNFISWFDKGILITKDEFI